jgi:hypothetical protein
LQLLWKIQGRGRQLTNDKPALLTTGRATGLSTTAVAKEDASTFLQQGSGKRNEDGQDSYLPIP